LDVVQEETTAVTTAEAQRKPRDTETAIASQSAIGELLEGETEGTAPALAFLPVSQSSVPPCLCVDVVNYQLASPESPCELSRGRDTMKFHSSIEECR